MSLICSKNVRAGETDFDLNSFAGTSTCFDTDTKRNLACNAAGRATKSPVQSTPAI